MLHFVQMMFAGGVFQLDITSNVANPNLPALATAAGWDGASRLLVKITAPYVNTLNLQSGWSFPGGLEIEIAAGSLVGGTSPAGVGGTALAASIPVTIRNLGTIAGGGGKGGDGELAWVTYSTDPTQVIGYGGSGGLGQGFRTNTATTPSGAAGGSVGTGATYAGSVIVGQTAPWAQGGNGGPGGAWGQAGSNGGNGSIGGTYSSSGGIAAKFGSAGGNAVVGNANITWLATGTRLGAVT